jgi:hypothetical protein
MNEDFVSKTWNKMTIYFHVTVCASFVLLFTSRDTVSAHSLRHACRINSPASLLLTPLLRPIFVALPASSLPLFAR